MKNSYANVYTFVLILLVAGTLTACDNSNPVDGGEDNTDIEVPTAYSFESRFEDGVSAVAYPGQVTRNLLIQDLKIMTDRLAQEGAEPVAEEDLLARYEYSDQDLAILTGTDPDAAAEQYNDIATDKSLAGKVTSQYGNQELIGRDVTADELVRQYLAIIASNAQDPDKLGTPAVYTTEEGVDLSQMVNKLLLGAVVYSQATGKYLDLIGSDDNAGPAGDGEPFTQMAHHWDEAFGYFGAARDYAQYSDEDLTSGNIYQDTDGDGQIDFSSEYNFTYATYAGKRDAGGTGVNFTQDLFNAFLEGRTAIVNESALDEILQHRDKAARVWEKVVAANIVHYLNSALGDMEELTQSQVGEKNNEEYNEHWSEGKGFAYALQYNAFREITDEELRQLHDLLGGAPVYALPGSEEAQSYQADLNAAKDLLQDVYGFSDANMEGW